MLQRHFIDLFAASQSFVGPMLLELKESLAVLNNVDDLRKHAVLSPMEQGDLMGAYTKRAVSYFPRYYWHFSVLMCVLCFLYRS